MHLNVFWYDKNIYWIVITIDSAHLIDNGSVPTHCQWHFIQAIKYKL